MSSSRLHAARQAPVALPCALCGAANDSAHHLLQCQVTQAAFRLVEDALPEQAQAPASLPQLFSHTEAPIALLQFTIALFTAAWGCRGAVRRGGSTSHLASIIARAVQHPWLLSGRSSTSRERRAARIRAPLEILAWFGRYRSDGAFAPDVNGFMVGAWGAAWWSPGNSSTLPPQAFAADLCPDPSSNNIAEFYGFRECLRRALSDPVLTPLVFELDSMLVVQCINGEWGCHRAHLRVLLQDCYDLGEGLAQRRHPWSVRHIYREFNTVADRLAGAAIRRGHGAESPLWYLGPDGSDTESTTVPSSSSPGESLTSSA